MLAAAAAVLVAAALLVPAAVRGPDTTSPRDSLPNPGLRVAERIGAAELLRAAPIPASVPRVDPAELAGAEQQFALDLLRRVDHSGNATVSPAGLALALAMLEHGARGVTAREIADVLHTGALHASRQGAAWHALLAGWTAAARSAGIRLDSATALWQQRGMSIGRPFATALDRYYGTGIWQVDFAHDPGAATDAINEWTRRQTHDRIKQLFAPGMLDQWTRAVLADVVYFKAAWATPFAGEQTRPGQFTRADGTTTTTAFMHAGRTMRAAVNDQYCAVELPYRGGRYAAVALMPRTGSVADLTRSLSPASLGTIVDGLHSTWVDLALPRFQTSSVLDLKPILTALGMPTAFSDKADLSGINDRLHVQSVVQRTYLKVGEKGTEAAAATGIGLGVTAVPGNRLVIRMDHPFLFLIRDTKTGAILFASSVQDPQS